jgi:hypothetical protein
MSRNKVISIFNRNRVRVGSVKKKQKKTKKTKNQKKNQKKNFFFTIYLGNIPLVYYQLISDKIERGLSLSSISTTQSTTRKAKWNG